MYCTVLYSTVDWIVMYTIQYKVMYSTVQYSRLDCNVHYTVQGTVQYKVLYSIRYCTVQGTVQYKVLYSTRYSTVQIADDRCRTNVPNVWFGLVEEMQSLTQPQSSPPLEGLPVNGSETLLVILPF